MKTLHLTTTDNDISAAAAILLDGGLVAFPTETVYGLGVNAFDATAVARIFEAKGRPADNPLIVHIADVSQLDGIVGEVNGTAIKLIEKFSPGPLTIVMPKAAKIPKIVTAGLDSVAVRMPCHPIALKLLQACGLPIAAPSANISGKPSPTLFRHVAEDLDGKIDAIIDGGACEVGLESTVIDVTGDIPLLLRPGGITLEQLTDVVGEVKCNFEHTGDEPPRSPGTKYKHYAPNTKVCIIRGNLQKHIDCNNGVRAGVLACDEMKVPDNMVLKRMTSSNLFALLREFDGENVDVIYAQDVDGCGINLAVRNRLYKAAGYSIIDGVENG